MPILGDDNLLRTLDPAASDTRFGWARSLSPWTSGHRLLASAGGASKLAGLNEYPIGDGDHIEIVRGVGADPDAAGFAYEVENLTLPLTADISEPDDFLDAILLVYPSHDQRDSAVVLPRVEYGGTPPSGPYWMVTDTDEIELAYGWNSDDSEYLDAPIGSLIEVIVPTTADITVLWTPATAGEAIVLAATDFFAGGVVGGDDGIITLQRAFA